MCGIFGYIGKNAGAIDDDKIVSVLKHRGPDDYGIYIEGNVKFIHRRLSIIDLSENGHQPMLSDDRSIVICFNGEIYNHLDIRKELTSEFGQKFKSNSDTETILAAYQRWGIDFISKLNGIFAFLIYDLNKGNVFAVRDHFGVKPLYIYYCNDEVAFSSELKAFLDLPGFDPRVDKPAFLNYVSYLWSPGEGTPFADVKKLLPGHLMEFDVGSGKYSVSKWYDIPFNGRYSSKTEGQLIDELDIKLQKAVERQLLSDVPISFFLSGGLDSSLLVAIAKKLIKKRLVTYTIDTSALADKEGFADDLHYARVVAEYLDVELRIVSADIEIVKDFDKMIYHLDEPQADAAPLNVLNICRQAKQDGFIVMIGGAAGDDVFSGYRRHRAIRLERYLKFIPLPFRKLLKRSAGLLNARNLYARRMKKVLNELDLKTHDRLANYFSWLPSETLKGLFVSDIARNYVGNQYLHNLLNNIPSEKSWLNRMLYWEMKSFLVDHNLNYTDKMSMAVGVEVRVPYLDTELVEFACTIPPELKMKGKTEKYILKKVAERYLPPSIIYRPKTGFGAPVRSWIINDLGERISQELAESKLVSEGILDFQKVQKLIADNKSGVVDASYPIWSLLAIESWLKQFAQRQ